MTVYRRCMAQSILIFDFAKDEEAAQQARHKIDAWKQGFRLGNKILLKFDRGELAEKASAEEKPSGTPPKAEKEKAAGKEGQREIACGCWCGWISPIMRS